MLCTMIDVRLPVFMMCYLCIMMVRYGPWCAIICAVDTHVLYVKDECFRSYCMADYEWLTPFMG